jgi:catechol 2,3-dioxygenase-like lactoylglutathione lyase family enzyme|tara:strand:+ start:2718 stop:3095 length:378 start_codon:yes stop_codon:yes gene_type:complete
MAIEYDGTITLSSSVSDMDASIDWFKRVLGFEEIFRAPEAGWAEVTTPTQGVSLGLGQNEEAGGPGGTTPVFGVKDIAVAKADLEGKDVRFDGDVIEIPGLVKLATFYDPDGNTYMLAESLMQGA